MRRLATGEASRIGEEALERLETCAETAFRTLGAAIALHDLGRHDEADAALAELVERLGPDMPYRVAEAHAWRGDLDRCFDWLERAFAARDPLLGDLQGDPLMRNARGDPRFADLVRRLGLPVAAESP